MRPAEARSTDSPRGDGGGRTGGAPSTNRAPRRARLVRLTMAAALMLSAALLMGAADAPEPEAARGAEALAARGAEALVIPAPARGEVPFPHGRHQTALADCNLCHSVFAQQSGVIVAMKEKGELASKQVMNACVACHREKRQAGAATGPTSCSQCHKR